jgi:RNA polymerase sigma-70 factor (ECF subfamily)
MEVCSDAGTFRAWYDATLPRVFGYVLGHTAGDVALAEEVTQEAFVSAVRSRTSFDGRSEIVVWICSIARNALVDHHRRAARDARRHLSLVVREIALDGDARAWARVEDREQVQAALAALPSPQRMAIVLRYADGLSVREIARSLHRSEASVESLLSRGRDRLRVLLEGSR